MSAGALDVTDPLAAGQAALARGDWREARACFDEAVAADEHDPDAWNGLGHAAWWLGDEQLTFAARERAFREYRERGEVRSAAGVAQWIASDNLDFRGADAIALAWLARGRELLADEDPCAELGYIVVTEADIALLAREDAQTASEQAREALEIARAVGDRGVEAVALAVLGCALLALGSTAEGFERLDESAALAVGEDFTMVAAPGWALCHTVTGCTGAGDFSRAAQWCRALHTWSENWTARHFFGVCRAAYGEVLTTAGDWATADQELSSAMADLVTTRPGLAAPTAIRLGRLRERQGRLSDARELFTSALPLPQAIVALGALDLLEDDPAAAIDAAERVLRRLDDAQVLDRLPALELLAHARCATGEIEQARTAAGEVELLGLQLATPYMRARGRLVQAHVLVAAGEHEAGRQAAEDAADLFAACAAPYEGAQAQLVLADALEKLGRTERAAAEAGAARETFRQLGARLEGGDADSELSPRETDILRLVARGLSDAEIAERLFLSPHTVHRHVANIRTKLRVPSRAAAVARATENQML